MIKAVIFDMDGLIVDTETIQSKSWEVFLKKHNRIPTFEENGLVHIVGIAGDESFIKIKEKFSLPHELEALKKEKRADFEEFLKEKLYANEGFSELLETLKKHKYTVAVASNRFEKHIYLILENLGVKEHFDIIVGPNEKLRHKPYPDIFLHTAKQLHVSPKNCVVLEDSSIGVQSGKAAGMKVIAVPNTYTKSSDFSIADRVVDSLKSVTIKLINSL